MMDDTEDAPSSSSPLGESSSGRKEAKESFFTTDEFDDAVALAGTRPEESAKTLLRILNEVDADAESAAKKSKMKEEAIYKLGKIFVGLKDGVTRIKQLMIDIRPFFGTISKPRSAKIVRALIDEIGAIPGSAALAVQLCLDAIEWCIKEKRAFLRQRIQARLAGLYLQLARYKESLAVIRKLVREVKKFDDKPLMVEAELIESHVYFLLENVPKSKAALTTARANASAFYCPPLLQAQIDMQAGVLCAAERDFKTAFSYFYEAFEGFSSSDDNPPANRALKYMLLSKIIGGQPGDVHAIINSKGGLKYAGPGVEAMKAVAGAYKASSIHALAEVLVEHKAELGEDPVVAGHLGELNESLLEANIRRVVEPFSRVQVEHVAVLMALPRAKIEAKLSQMVLDKQLQGILDQGSDDLILFDESKPDPTFTTSLALIKELDGCVDRLYAKMQKLTRT